MFDLKGWVFALVLSVECCVGCDVALELVLLQDVTDSFDAKIVEVKRDISEFVDRLIAAYPGSKFGMVTFGDKPIPYSGYGMYASTHGDPADDTCYIAQVPLTNDSSEVFWSVQDITTSGGNDAPENNFEAFLNVAAAEYMGWSHGDFDSNGRHILRIGLMVTDSISHTDGDAFRAISKWNDNWGIPKKMDSWLFEYGECNSRSVYWEDLNSLGEMYRSDPLSLTESEKNRFAEVLKNCGPYPFPVPEPAVGVDGQLGIVLEDCVLFDYPSDVQMAMAVKDRGLIPMVLVPPSHNTGLLEWMQSWDACPGAVSDAQCVVAWWKNVFNSHGVEGVFVEIDDKPSKLFPEIMASVKSLEAGWCAAKAKSSKYVVVDQVQSDDATVHKASSPNQLASANAPLPESKHIVAADMTPADFDVPQPESASKKALELPPHDSHLLNLTSGCKCEGENCLCDDEIEIRVNDLGKLLKMLSASKD